MGHTELLYILFSFLGTKRGLWMFGSEMQLLELCSKKQLGIREILSILGGSRTSKLRLIKELERSGSLELTQCPNGRGRPKKIVTLSPLGIMMLENLKSINDMMIKMNENDMLTVLEQLRLRNKIIDSGIDPYERFIEMNEIALNIRNSAESSASI
jgi:DNA-binding MarR family transcriptional regulator